MRSGLIYVPAAETLNDLGEAGLYWSSYANGNGIDARYLYFYVHGVGPADYYFRYRAFSLRCLAS